MASKEASDTKEFMVETEPRWGRTVPVPLALTGIDVPMGLWRTIGEGASARSMSMQESRRVSSEGTDVKLVSEIIEALEVLQESRSESTVGPSWESCRN